MVFKNFRFQIIFRVLLLTLAISVLAWCLVNGWYLRSVYAAVAVVIIVVELIWYVDRFNRDVRSFMVSLQQRDFTTHFLPKGRSKSFDELYETLNNISGIFKTISAEKEVQFRYLEMLVEHLRVGILSMDETGKILLANQALKKLLRRDVFFSLKSVASSDAALANALWDIRTGETRLLKVRVENELLQLSIHASEFRLEDQYHKLISMQNIRNELDVREMEAWHKLIRVLTHEIMNSVSPVISLSETLHGRVNEHRESLNRNPALYHALDKGLEAIQIRSQGLYHFTQSYRKLTAVPKLSLKKTSSGEIVRRVMVLMENKFRERGISVSVSTVDMSVVVDPDLIEHVLINLLLNAAEALTETPDPLIEIRAVRNAEGHLLVSVRDNGEGIDEATAEKMFTPFFTTREHGSGIGLALTRQILQLHHAGINFTSEKGRGTEFVIMF